MQLYVEMSKDKEIAKLLTQFRLGITSGFDKLPKNIQDIITHCSIELHQNTEHDVIVILQIKITTATDMGEAMDEVPAISTDEIIFPNDVKVSPRAVKSRAVKQFGIAVGELINFRISTFQDEVDTLRTLLTEMNGMR